MPYPNGSNNRYNGLSFSEIIDSTDTRLNPYGTLTWTGNSYITIHGSVYMSSGQKFAWNLDDGGGRPAFNIEYGDNFGTVDQVIFGFDYLSDYPFTGFLAGAENIQVSFWKPALNKGKGHCLSTYKRSHARLAQSERK